MEVAGYRRASAFRSPLSTIFSHDMERIPVLRGSTNASAAYPAANLAIYVPFVLESPVTVYETFVVSGSLTTSNATEIGVYDTAGTRLFTTATTVNVANDVINSSGMTDYVLSPGAYYMAFACDGTRNFFATSFVAGLYQSFGFMEQTGLTGANLPTTATFAAYTRAYLPQFGLNLRTDAL